MLSLKEIKRQPTPAINFSDTDLNDVTPHEGDPIELSVVMMG